MNAPFLKGLGLLLLIAVMAALLLSGLWLKPESSAPESTASSAEQAAIERTAQRTRRISQFGAQPAGSQSPPSAPPASTTKPIASDVSLPEGYTLAEHKGTMHRARLNELLKVEISPNPDWLDPAIGVDRILDQPRAHQGEPVFAALRLAPGTTSAKIEDVLTRLGARIKGTSGDSVRIVVPPEQARIQAIAELPGIIGVGALPSELKLDPEYAESTLTAPASQETPVFITLMGEDSSGQYKHLLAGLGVTVGDYDTHLRSYTANVPASALQDLAAADYVMRIEPIGVVGAMHGSAVPVMGIDRLRGYDFAQESFAGLTGRGIGIGVLDTGLNVRHADIAHGRNSICGANFVFGENWDLWADLVGHGTHVMGTIAGAGRDDALRAGMAPNVSHLRFAKVLSFLGFGSDDDIRRGMDYLSRPSFCFGSNGQATKPLIANLSLGTTTVVSTGRSIAERKLDAVVHAEGQLYVVAQANSDARGFSNFGTAKNTLAVGAVHDSGVIASFSSHGPTADGRLAPKVAGTGVGIWSARGAGSRSGYESYSGTSMASPSVAGVAALLLEADANLRHKPALVRARLMASAIRPDPYLDSSEQFPLDNSKGPGRMQNEYGMGLVSARVSIASLNSADGWLVASAEASPTAAGYERARADLISS